MKPTIVVPAYNEEANIANVIEQIEKTLDFDYELIVVNDHSKDRTREIVEGLIQKYNNITLIDNQRPGGFANALKTGFENVKTDVLVPVMGDLCDDLNTIKKMLRDVEAGSDIVCGARYVKEGGRLGGSRFKAMLSGLGGISLHLLLGIPTHDAPNAFKMYRKEVIDNVEINAKGFEISMEITLKAFFKGYKISEIPTVWHERTEGESSFNVLGLLPKYLKLYTWAVAKKLKIIK